ncbi:MAG TPA: hypothetical protein VH520_10755 [Streptosporangiaceae bacterium]
MDDPVVLVAEVVDLEAAGGRDVRDGEGVSIARISTYSCSTWLCSTFARSASGAVALPRLRKTAVPAAG